MSAGRAVRGPAALVLAGGETKGLQSLAHAGEGAGVCASAGPGVAPVASDPAPSGRLAREAAWRFGAFTFDRRRGLAVDGRSVALTPIAERLLDVLLDAGGRLVTRQELAARGWDRDDVSDESISRAVYAIRQRMREHGGPQAIETRYRRGYRIAVPVEAIATGDGVCTDAIRTAADYVRRARSRIEDGDPFEHAAARVELDRALRLLEPAATTASRPAADETAPSRESPAARFRRPRP